MVPGPADEQDVTLLCPSDLRGRVPVPDLLRTGGVHCAYQPVVELATGEVVGREALLRTPEGSGWGSPLEVLDAAQEEGLLGELERASMSRALADAAEASRGAGHTLFLNIEPRTLSRHIALVLETLARRDPHVRVVVEITERALAHDPAGILDAAARLREAGCAIALDDVGAVPDSLAFLPLLAPEVIKLDLQLLRTLEDPATITVAGAVRARAEATGARVVAEGIETHDDLTRALVLGADLGQGWYLGRPHRVLPAGERHTVRLHRAPEPPEGDATPYELVASRRAVRLAPKHLLLPLSRTLETAALAQRVPPLLLGTFQDERHFTGGSALRYGHLAERLPFVGALGTGAPASVPGGVRWARVEPDEALAREWAVVVLGAHESVALVGREVGPPSSAPAGSREDRSRQFEFAVTHDHALVAQSAHALLRRFGADGRD